MNAAPGQTPQPETIDLTPTTEQDANLAAFFARAVLDDARDDRRRDTAHMLGTVVELVAYLARHNDGAQLLDRIKQTIKESTR